MISSFEVGNIFKVIDEATPGLRKILGEVRRLREVISAAKAELGEFSKAVAPAIGGAVKETNTLTAAWERVGQAAREASAQVVRAAETAKGAAAAATGGIAGSGNRFRPRSGGGGTGGVHVYGPGVPIPGGGHAHFGSAGMAGLGLLGYGVYQAMQYDDAVALMATHAGVDLQSNRQKFRKILQDAAIATGYGEHEISAAAQQELRMFKYTPGEGNGISALPTMLRLAATESRLKGTPLEESMKAETGLAHMVGKYSEADVTKLAAAFSALSVSNPMTLAQQERAFSYSVPVLQAGMDIDAIDTMAASTALARAGITSTKAGTWVREMMKGAMPGTSFETKTRFKKHEAALRELGLVDKNHKPTWFVDGKPSEMKFLEKVAEALPKIPVERRMAVLGGLAGTQGAGALAVLAEPVVQEQLKKIAADVKDPQSVARIQNFLGEYNRDSSLQNAHRDADLQRHDGRDRDPVVAERERRTRQLQNCRTAERAGLQRRSIRWRISHWRRARRRGRLCSGRPIGSGNRWRWRRCIWHCSSVHAREWRSGHRQGRQLHQPGQDRQAGAAQDRSSNAAAELFAHAGQRTSRKSNNPQNRQSVRLRDQRTGLE